MSRDLCFWKQKEKSDLTNAEIYKKLSSGVHIDCVSEIPTEQIKEDIDKEFKDWEKEGDSFFQKGNSSFGLFVTSQVVRFDCYSVSEIVMNKIIDIMLKYDCPLYDSVIDIRFD